MEPYIKEIFSDITYMSELILDTNAMTFNFESYVSRINSHSNLCSLAFHKLRAH
jgi:hypothetical protein